MNYTLLTALVSVAAFSSGLCLGFVIGVVQERKVWVKQMQESAKLFDNKGN